MTDHPPVDNPRSQEKPLNPEIVRTVTQRFLDQLDHLQPLLESAVQGMTPFDSVNTRLSFDEDTNRVQASLFDAFQNGQYDGYLDLDQLNLADFDPEQSDLAKHLAEEGFDLKSMHFIEVGQVTDERFAHNPLSQDLTPRSSTKRPWVSTLYILGRSPSSEPKIVKLTSVLPSPDGLAKDISAGLYSEADIITRSIQQRPLTGYIESPLVAGDFEILASGLKECKKRLMNPQGDE